MLFVDLLNAVRSVSFSKMDFSSLFFVLSFFLFLNKNLYFVFLLFMHFLLSFYFVDCISFVVIILVLHGSMHCQFDLFITNFFFFVFVCVYFYALFIYFFLQLFLFLHRQVAVSVCEITKIQEADIGRCY